MSKTLVAYFSASGVTAKLAKTLSSVTGADLFEIKPVTPYTAKDLDWMDKKSRSTIEMQDKASRPEMAEKLSSCAQYDTIFVGFPIWWYEAPRIIETFLESCDLSGKTVVPFGTSGGSSMGKTAQILAPSCPGAKVLSGKVLRASSSEANLRLSHGWEFEIMYQRTASEPYFSITSNGSTALPNRLLILLPFLSSTSPFEMICRKATLSNSIVASACSVKNQPRV